MDWVLKCLEPAKNTKSSTKPDRVLNLRESAKITESGTKSGTETASKPGIKPAPKAAPTAEQAPELAPHQDKIKKPVDQVQKSCCHRRGQRRPRKLKIENSSDAETTIKKQTKKMTSQEKPKSITSEAKNPVQNAEKIQVQQGKGHHTENKERQKENRKRRQKSREHMRKS